MTDAPTLIYLEADDEITSVIRRMRAADPGRVVVVAPGRSRATSSAVALRLLARAAADDGREVAVVGDALTRSLAAEAGVTSHATVDEAQDNASSEVPDALTQTAAIHVVRGPERPEPAPSGAHDPASRAADTTIVAVSHDPSHPRPDRRPGSRPPPRHRPPPGHRPPPRARHQVPGRRRLSTAVGLGIIGAVLVTWGVIAALVLPAATIAITPRTEVVGPVADLVTFAQPERLQGSVTETVSATATGTYDINTPAAGTVTFFNWNFFSVRVPAGSLVAAEEQTFATAAEVVVPAGRFDPFGGGITAGEVDVNVTASQPGPAGNVAAEAINTIVDRDLAGQLRGFPTITEALVLNAEPTTGGETSTGPEFTQEDVDAALAALHEALDAALAEALSTTDGTVFADVGEGPPAPEITGLDGLVGKRDVPTAELSSEWGYDRVYVATSDVQQLAAERFAASSSVVPDGWRLDEAQTAVTIGAARREGDGLVVPVEVRGIRLPVVERADVLKRTIGLSAADAAAALSDLGSATVSLWPAWVGTVPDSDWRIDVQVGEP